ncbi:MAG TPA: glycosyltransferase family 39 protein [Ktedonobacteraceae bacterium]
MSNEQIDSIQTAKEIHSQRSAFLRKIGSWFCVWEIYPILGIAAFIRFYQITTTEFDADQAMVFRMARDAISHGLIPATSNIASIRIVNPPAVTYLLMIPAAFSANPLWGAIFVAFFNVIAVLLTYVFVRRYYGRIASIIASLLYATAATPLHFSRFIWQQNLIAPFVVLFILALFWGVVDRRKGWLFPALVLLGILVQLHETTIILSLLLVVALLLAPGTVRLRDLALGLTFLLLLFSTYLLWEFSVKFADLNILLQVSKLPAHFDLKALNYYRLFLNPYDTMPTDTHTLEYKLIPLLEWLRPSMAILMIFGFVTIAIGVISLPQLRKGDSGVDEEHRRFHRSLRRALQIPRILWVEFRATPQRCGYLLLLTWQIVPLLVLSRHSVPVFPYYLLMLMPGPFIIIGIFLSSLIHWLQRQGMMWDISRYGVYVFTSLVIVAQLIGSLAGLIDEARGNNLHGYSYNTLNSLEDALNEADQLALLHNINHVYITTDQFTQVSLSYLAEQMRTPTTLFNASRCLVLPDPSDGPAVLLVGPYDKLTGALLSQFAISTLVDQPKRLGSVPFQLYIVQPIAGPKPTPSNEAFVNNLQLIDKQAQQFRIDNSNWFATRWSYMYSAPPDYRTTYTYSMKALFNNTSNTSSQCVTTSLRAGDQLIMSFPLLQSADAPSSMAVSVVSFTTKPLNVSLGPFRLETIKNQSTRPLALQTAEGKTSITLLT